MAALLGAAGWLLLVCWLLARALRQFRVHRTGAVPPPAGDAGTHRVAVIIPARDEAHNIAPCLASLAPGQGAGPAAVLVVDDGSRDATAAIVRGFARRHSAVALRAAGPLPPGWMGKPHACWRGAQAAGSPSWLCFIDADVRAEPGLLAAAVQTAERRGLALLSLSPRHVLGSFWERLVIPAGMLVLACAIDMEAVARPGSEAVTANGQFMLVRRDAYFAAGGHGAVRAEVCEDRALAARIKARGGRIAVLGGERLLRVRLYDGLPALWQGFAKNAQVMLGSARRTLLAAAVAVLVAWAAPLLPPGLAILAWLHPAPAHWLALLPALAGSGIVFGVLLGTGRHFGIAPFYALLFPLAAGTAACIACHSVLPGLRRTLRWKGRPLGGLADPAAKPP